jgi:hypothetical protein
MKQEKWRDIFKRLEEGEITETRAQKELLREYGASKRGRVRQCN